MPTVVKAPVKAIAAHNSADLPVTILLRTHPRFKTSLRRITGPNVDMVPSKTGTIYPLLVEWIKAEPKDHDETAVWWNGIRNGFYGTKQPSKTLSLQPIKGAFNADGSPTMAMLPEGSVSGYLHVKDGQVQTVTESMVLGAFGLAAKASKAKTSVERNVRPSDAFSIE